MEMSVNFANPRNSQTFPAAYFFIFNMSPFYLSTDFGNSQTFLHAKRLALQIGKFFDTCKYPLILYYPGRFSLSFQSNQSF